MVKEEDKINLRDLLGDEGWAEVICARIEDYVANKYKEKNWHASEDNIVHTSLQWVEDIIAAGKEEELENFMSDCILEFVFSSTPEKRAKLLEKI